MSATIVPGTYLLQFGLEFSESNTNVPPLKPLYLTNHGEGKQLTIESATHELKLNQEWKIDPPLKDLKDNSAHRIIIPALSKEILAASQDVVGSPDKVSLLKNLQIWSFEEIRESDQLYEIRSTLHHEIGSDPLLGVDKKFQKVIIQFIPVIAHPPPRPVWKLIALKE